MHKEKQVSYHKDVEVCLTYEMNDMTKDRTIRSVVAEEIFTERRGHVALRIVVTTENGTQGTLIPAIGACACM